MVLRPPSLCNDDRALEGEGQGMEVPGADAIGRGFGLPTVPSSVPPTDRSTSKFPEPPPPTPPPPRRTFIAVQGEGPSIRRRAMGKLDGKVAVVTGASSGIGEATAIALAAEGAK